MAGFFTKLVKGLMIGAGTILSIIPRTLGIGAPLIVAGSAINTSTAGTQDVLSAYATGLISQIPALQVAQQSTQSSNLVNSIIAWVQNNIILIVVGIAAFFLLFKSKRRR